MVPQILTLFALTVGVAAAAPDPTTEAAGRCDALLVEAIAAAPAAPWVDVVPEAEPDALLPYRVTGED